MQSVWDSIIQSWPYGDRLFLTACICLGHSLLTMPMNFMAFVLYMFPQKFSNEWKIQQDAEPSPALVRETVISVLVNHFIVSPLSAYFIIWPLFCYLEMPIHGPIPSFSRILLEFAVFGFFNDLLFYWAHRMFHSHPWIYKTFHSRHHRFITPISWAAEYSTITESIVANTIPALAGCFIMRAHLFTITCWLIFAMSETLDAHSGFKIPFSIWRLFDPILLGPEGHDWHHSHNRGNYGLFKFWDWFCGTDKEYRLWLQKRKEELHEE